MSVRELRKLQEENVRLSRLNDDLVARLSRALKTIREKEEEVNGTYLAIRGLFDVLPDVPLLPALADMYDARKLLEERAVKAEQDLMRFRRTTDRKRVADLAHHTQEVEAENAVLRRKLAERDGHRDTEPEQKVERA